MLALGVVRLSTKLNKSSRMAILFLLPTILLLSIDTARAEIFRQEQTATIIVQRGLAQDNSLVFRYDGKRTREDTTVTFQIVGASVDSQVPPPSVQVVNDLLSANPDGFLRASRIKATPPVRDASGIYVFRVNVDLPAALTSSLGAYGSGAAFDGSLKIVAGDATAIIPIRIKIRPSPWGPFALLVLSLVFGALMRWWAESGRLLHRQYDRYIWLSRFSGEEAQSELERARFYLDRWRPAEAEETLDAVEKQLKPNTASTKLDNSSTPLTKPAIPRKTWRRWLLNVIPATIFLITSLSIAMYGFQTLYAGNLTFGAKGLGDWINLAGWGFAAGYAGKTVNDYFIGKAGGTAKLAG
jgi:hypothetical protein